MRVINDILYLEYGDITDLNISDDTIKRGLIRNREGNPSWAHIQDPEDGRKVLIVYDSIPSPTLTKYNVPSREVYLYRWQQDRQKEAVVRIYDWGRGFEKADEKTFFIKEGYPREKACDLAFTAAFLRLLAEVKGKKDIQKLNKQLGTDLKDKKELKEVVLRLLSESTAGIRVTNMRVLERKVKAFKESGLSSMLHAGRGNKRALKMTEDVKSVLLSLYMNEDSDVKLNDTQVWAVYQNVYAKDNASQFVNRGTGEVIEDFPSLSIRSVTKFLETNTTQTLVARHRHGSKYYKDTVRPYILGKSPEYSFSLSSSDGFTMPFWLKHPKKSKWGRATVYIIFDVHSRAVLGASVGLTETNEVIKHAFLDMVKRTGNRVPLDNQLDNFNASFAKSMEGLIGVRMCAPYNSQSKYAERCIADLKRVMKAFEGYVGRHSAKTATNKRNPDKLNPANGDVGYTLAETRELLNQAIDIYNNQVPNVRKGGLTRAEMLENFNPESKVLEDLQVVTNWGIRTKATINRGYIHLTYKKEDYTFSIIALEDAHSTLAQVKNHFKVRVRFIPDELARGIWIYNYDAQDKPANDVLISHVPMAEFTQRAHAEQTEEDKRILGRQLRDIERFEQAIEEEREDMSGKIIPLTPEEADGVLSAGYTTKEAIKAATEIIESEQPLMPPTPPVKKKSNNQVNRRWRLQ